MGIMAASIKGKQISWGISAEAVALAAAATTSGIIESVSVDRGGEVSKIVDENGEVVTRVDHGTEIKADIEVKALSDSTLPAKGDEIFDLEDVDDLPFSTGRTFVESAKVTYNGNDAKKISISVVNYPDMEAEVIP